MEIARNHKIPITWQILHRDIFETIMDGSCTLSPQDFMERIFPENLFDLLFASEGILWDPILIADTYYAAGSAKTVFSRMGDHLIVTQKQKKKPYTFDTCPAVKAFQKNWEELIPGIRKVTARDAALEDALTECICNGVFNDFPDEYREVVATLNRLWDSGQYSMILAILSVIATTLPCFDEDPEEASEVDLAVRSVVQNSSEKKNRTALKKSEVRSGVVPITLKTLHEEVLLRLNPETKLTAQIDFVLAVIPEYLLREMELLTEDKETNKKYKYDVYKAGKWAPGRNQKARAYIIGRKTEYGEDYRYDTSPVIRDFQAIWELLVPASRYTANDDAAEAGAVQDAVTKVVDAIPEDPLAVRIRMAALCQKEPFSLVLAILSAIASVVYCFAQPFCDEDTELHDILLPPMPEANVSGELRFARSAISDDSVTFPVYEQKVMAGLHRVEEMGETAFLLYTKALQQNVKGKAAVYLEKAVFADHPAAKRIYYTKQARDILANGQRISCAEKQSISEIYFVCANCERILTWSSYIPREVLAEVSYILYFYINKGWYEPGNQKGRPRADAKEVAKRYLELSHQCGYNKATEAWKAMQSTTSIVPDFHPSDCKTKGIYYANTGNRFADAFMKSAPAGWQRGELAQVGVEDPAFGPMPRRFLLLDDDFTGNMEALFRLLHMVQTRKPEKEDLNWEIFIRHDSESVHMLIDTAMARIPEYTLPIYILNDAKAAAQQLLVRHPLHYPVRFLSLKTTQVPMEHRPLLQFVILGDSDVAEWLVREAFTLLGFRNNAIRAKITVLAEKDEKFKAKLRGRFPGMFQDQTEIRNIVLPEIFCEYIEPDSVRLKDCIERISTETPYCYFAVATESDERNLTLATRIREFLIRTAIKNKEEDRLYHMPPVAFYCRNTQIAHLSSSMVVENERHGLRWFNTRSLIPFGDVSSQYSFDSITGGTFANLAKCIHFQYSQKSPLDVLTRSEEAVSSEREFYFRQYNQDSSYSIALSMPYRLFQFRGRASEQLIPEAWDIRDGKTFSSVARLREMAAQLQNIEEESIQVAEWEHDRWVRWMLSRGWMPASFEDAVFACQCGNPRQQLFACKMHPCICGYDELDALSGILKEQCGLQKDFYRYDLDNIMDTQKLLNLEWIRQEKETERATER